MNIFPPVCSTLSVGSQQPGIGGTWKVGSQNRAYLRVNCWRSTYTRCSVFSVFENVLMISTFFISLNEYGWISEWNWTSEGEFIHSTSSRNRRPRPTWILHTGMRSSSTQCTEMKASPFEHVKMSNKRDCGWQSRDGWEMWPTETQLFYLIEFFNATCTKHEALDRKESIHPQQWAHINWKLNGRAFSMLIILFHFAHLFLYAAVFNDIIKCTYNYIYPLRRSLFFFLNNDFGAS